MESTPQLSPQANNQSSTTPPVKEEPKVLEGEKGDVFMDIPVKEEKETGSKEYVDIPQPNPRDNARKADGVNAAIHAMSAGQDVVSAFSNAYLANEDYIAANADENSRSTIASVVDLAGQAPANTIASAVKAYSERHKDNLLGPYKAFIDNLPDAQLLSQSERDEAAYYAYVQDMTAKAWDATSKWDIVKDMGSAVVWDDSGKRLADLSEHFGLNHELGDYISSEDLYAKMATALQQMPVEGRAHIINHILENWESFGFFTNKMDVTTFLSRMMKYDDNDKHWTMAEDAGRHLDTALVGKAFKPVFQFAKGLKSLTGTLRRVNQLKNISHTADVVNAGMKGALVEAGVDPLSAANSLVPARGIQALTPDTPPGIAHRLHRNADELAKLVDETESLGLPLSAADREAAIARARTAAKLEPNVTNVEIGALSGTDFELKISTTNGVESRKIAYTMDDIGSWTEAEQVTKGIRGLNSPQYMLPGLKEDLVSTPHFALLQGARVRASFDKAMMKVKLGKRGFKKVDNLLLRGDNEGKVFSYMEAVEQGIGGVKYTPKEYEAYANIRQTLDVLHDLQSKRLLAKMRANGLKKLEVGGFEYAGKSYDSEKSALAALRSGEAHSKWWTMNGKVNRKPLTPQHLKQLYARGYRLVRNSGEDFFNAGGQMVEWAVVKGNSVTDLTTAALPRVPGYVPKMRKEGNFFLKRLEEVDVGGKKVTKMVTERYSGDFKTLEDFRKNLPDAEKYVVTTDRKLLPHEMESEILNVQGGLFSGHRSSRVIPYGTGELEGARRTAMDSIQAYINNISRSLPIEVWRDGLKQKWINSARERGALTSYKPGDSFFDLKVRIKADHPLATSLKRSYDEVAFMSGVRTTSETIWQNAMYAIGRGLEWMPLGRIPARVLYSDTIMNIPNAVKTMAYYSFLGLSPAQYFIQASGGIVCLATNPIHGVKGIAHASAFTFLDALGKAKTDLPVLAKKAGLDLNAWNLWNKSGMKEALTAQNLDYSSIFHHAPYDAGLLRRIISNADVFVQMGEMSYSRLAFGTAYDYITKKLGRLPTEADLPKIIERADLYRLNMSRANTAGFQKGLMGIPTQFMQVQTKFLEKLMGQDFTTAEKMRMLVGQTAAFGAVGLPLVGSLYSYVLDLFKVNTDNVDADTQLLLQKGVAGYVIHDLFNMNVEFSGRIALGNDIAERLLQVAGGKFSVPEVVFGPSASIFTRGADLFETIVAASSFVQSGEDVSPQMLIAAAQVIAEAAAEIPSGTRNAMKGYVMYNSHLYKNKKGFPVFEYRDPSLRNSVAQAMGFQSTEPEDWYEIGGQSKFFEGEEAKDTYAKTMASIMVKMVNAGADRREVYATAYNAMRSGVLQQKGGDKVLKSVERYLTTPNTSWNKQIQKGIDIYTNECVDGFEEIMKRSKVRTNVFLAKELEKEGLAPHMRKQEK